SLTINGGNLGATNANTALGGTGGVGRSSPGADTPMSATAPAAAGRRGAARCS
ncbi:MAG: hypothetical protein K0S81_1907, partial [Rhodospirillales bacterium]|nr:hypothetical protein [Rhodospirillales bacterium]